MVLPSSMGWGQLCSGPVRWIARKKEKNQHIKDRCSTVILKVGLDGSLGGVRLRPPMGLISIKMQGNFLSINSEPHTVGRNAGLFWVLYQMSMMGKYLGGRK